MEKNAQILHISTNKTIFINNFEIKLGLLYKNAPVGVGGRIFNFNLYQSSTGLGDKIFRVNGVYSFINIFMFKFDLDPKFGPLNVFLYFLNWSFKV